MITAVIYTRVSSDEQVKGTSLETQAESCATYCRVRGWQVLNTFSDRGDSAKTADRPQFQAMIAWLKQHKADHLVFYDLKRFARNSHDHHVYRAVLSKIGVRLESVTEPLTDDPVGRFLETILAGAAQLDNETRAVICRQGMVEVTRRGGWSHTTPFGYMTARSADNLPILVPHPVHGPLVVEMFNGLADRRRNVRQTTDWLQQQSGRRWWTQAVQRMMRQKVYAGVLNSKLTNWKPIKAAFPGLVDEATFERAQIIKRPDWIPDRKPRVESFPLRGVLACDCGRHFTGSFSKGRSARYAYYHCKCGVRVSAKVIEAGLADLMRTAQEQTAPFLVIWRKMLAAAAAEMRAEVDATKGNVVKEITNLERRMERLLELYLSGGCDAADYKRRADDMQTRLTQLRCARNDAQLEDLEGESVIAEAELLLSDMSKLYASRGCADKLRLVRAVFGEVVYNPNGGLKMSNRHKSSIVSGLTMATQGDATDGGPGVSLIEPLRIMRAAIATVKYLLEAA